MTAYGAPPTVSRNVRRRVGGRFPVSSRAALRSLWSKIQDATQPEGSAALGAGDLEISVHSAAFCLASDMGWRRRRLPADKTVSDCGSPPKVMRAIRARKVRMYSTASPVATLHRLALEDVNRPVASPSDDSSEDGSEEFSVYSAAAILVHMPR